MLAAVCFYDMNVIISANFRRLILVCAIFHGQHVLALYRILCGKTTYLCLSHSTTLSSPVPNYTSYYIACYLVMSCKCDKHASVIYVELSRVSEALR